MNVHHQEHPSPIKVTDDAIVRVIRSSQSYVPPFHPTATCHHGAPAPRLEPLRLPALQEQFMADTMAQVREEAANNKRRKICAVDRGDLTDDGSSCRSGSVSGSVGSSSGSSGRFDLLEELDSRPDVVQVVATAGGLITHWNEPFPKLANKTSDSLHRTPLTIFELVSTESIGRLYGLLALALHNVGVVEVEDYRLDEENDGGSSSAESEEAEDVTGDGRKRSRPTSSSSPSHLSITLPCNKFQNGTVQYEITVVYLHDAPAGRCFLGVLAPTCNNDDIVVQRSSSLPRGRILRTDDDLLCRTLLRSR